MYKALLEVPEGWEALEKIPSVSEVWIHVHPGTIHSHVIDRHLWVFFFLLLLVYLLLLLLLFLLYCCILIIIVISMHLCW